MGGVASTNKMEILLAAMSIENLPYWGILFLIHGLSMGFDFDILLLCLYVGMKRYQKKLLCLPSQNS